MSNKMSKEQIGILSELLDEFYQKNMTLIDSVLSDIEEMKTKREEEESRAIQEEKEETNE